MTTTTITPTGVYFDYVTDKLGGSLDQIKAHLIASGIVKPVKPLTDREKAFQELLSTPQPFYFDYKK